MKEKKNIWSMQGIALLLQRFRKEKIVTFFSFTIFSFPLIQNLVSTRVVSVDPSWWGRTCVFRVKAGGQRYPLYLIFDQEKETHSPYYSMVSKFGIIIHQYYGSTQRLDIGPLVLNYLRFIPKISHIRRNTPSSPKAKQGP